MNYARSSELRQIMHNLADVGITSEQSIPIFEHELNEGAA
jgi:hypothetical protein